MEEKRTYKDGEKRQKSAHGQNLSRKQGKQGKKSPSSRGAKGPFRKLRIVLRAMFRVLRAAVVTLLILSVVILLAAGGVAFYKLYPIYQDYKTQIAGVVDESTLETFRLQEASYIYDANGEILAKLTGDEDSSYLTYDEIPQNAINAFVAIEDRTFWENPGIDLKGMLRVGINYLRTEGEEVHGASTITQQLARNRFLTREVSIERKVKEILISLDLTKKYTKEQIMEFYINDISFANTYYGLQAAARGYFGKDADELTLSQTAYLCAIPNSPTYYNPYRHPENALVRRDKILADMLEMGYITQSDYDEAVAETITVERQRVPMRNYETTYAIDCAVRYLMRRDGFEFRYGFRSKEDYEEYERKYNEVYEQERNALYTGGYNLYTSLVPEKQQLLQQSVDNVLSFDGETAENGVYALQGAATVVDNSTGKVVAIVGGRSQETDTYTLNRAFQSDRQPGSTIKPLIVYTPALENGYKSTTRVRNIDVDSAKEKGADVSKLPGESMELRRAVELSRNGVAWYIYDDITPDVGLAYLTQMRFDNIVAEDYYPATSLGGFTHGATTEEMAGAYAALANRGVYREPTCIEKMINNQGENIFQEYPSLQVYQESSAVMMTDILTGVIKRGTASSMGWTGEIEAAGKTGTTNASKDGWFCGMTPYYTLSVWVGYDQPKMLSSLYGATYPASIWKEAMQGMIQGLEPASFAEPETDDGRGHSGEYLAGHSGTYSISEGYSVNDFRSDHQLADRAMELTDMAREGDSGRSRTELRNEARDLAEQIKNQSMRERTEMLINYGAPVQQMTAPATVPETVTETVPEMIIETVPSGPGSDTGNTPQEQPLGPASEIIQ